MANVIGDSADPKIAAITGKHTKNGIGVSAISEQGLAIRAEAKKDAAMFASSVEGVGIDARSSKSTGLTASSEQGIGIEAGSIKNKGLYAHSVDAVGIDAKSTNSIGIEAASTKNTGLYAHSVEGVGIDARSTKSTGLTASSEQGIGIEAGSIKNKGLYAHSVDGVGIDARSTNSIGIQCEGKDYAGVFNGNIEIRGIVKRYDPEGTGRIYVKNSKNYIGVSLSCGNDAATLTFGGLGSRVRSTINMWDQNDKPAIALKANNGGLIEVSNENGEDTIKIDGNTGDIIFLNADCAEDFEISESEQVEAGTVMTLNDVGKLEKVKHPYDKRVAGVVSGAGDLKPGLVLGRQPGRADCLPIALIGRVHCKVDANHGSIEVGDLLTTSSTPGHAMKAIDPARSFGAVIGKALRPLKTGRGIIPILVALQ
jgi:hypothetical protein